MMRAIKATLGFVLLIVLALAAVVCLRAARARSRQPVAAPAPRAPMDPSAADRLAQALRFRTVSAEEPFPAGELTGLHAHLVRSFPAAFAVVEPEAIGEQSRLLTWRGLDPSLPPVVLMAHLDVVPVESGTEGAWTHPAFGGVIADGYVWGRGALDDKGPALGILEALERLVREGARPRRSVLVAFGCDEEVGGAGGASATASRLRERGLKPAFILDEGLAVIEGGVPGATRPVALIGIAEKGYVSLELTIETQGGHSSMPPPQTAIGILSAALTRLQERPMPASLEGPPRLMFEHLAPEMAFGPRLVLGNLWLFEPVLLRRLAREPTGNALIRTTTAPTIFSAGVKDNVLPQRARAVVNFRIRPGDSIQAVERHVREAIGDERIQVARVGAAVAEPSPVSPVDDAGYDVIARSVREVFPDALAAPGLVVGATDARHFTGLTPAIYRFAPHRLAIADLRRIHGTDERIGVEAYGELIRFYERLLRNAAL